MKPSPEEVADFRRSIATVHADVDERFSFAVLRDREVTMVHFVDAMTWAYANGGISEQVLLDDVGDKRVSTAFVSTICQESRYADKLQPFETYVSWGYRGEVFRKYATYAEAERGHAEILAELASAPSP